jgi:hypothetical protein
MRSIRMAFFYALLFTLASSVNASSQGLLKKAGQRLGREAERMLDKSGKKESESETDTDQNAQQQQGIDQPAAEGDYSSGSSGSKRKKMTPPDVNKSIADAETAFKARDFNDTRYNIQQALMGIELEIGYQVLNSLPKNIDGLDFIEEEDQVQSSGWGFQGFLVKRTFNDKKDKSVDISIINNAAMISGMNMVLSNPGYMNSSDNNQKSVKVGNYRALLTAEDNGSFTLGIPLGQSSLVNLELNEYADENEVIATAEKFDYESIKTMLGEQ